MTAPRRQWIWWLVWLLVAAAIAARAASRKETRGVLLDHLEFGRRLVAGEDVYGPWRSDPDAPVRPLHAPYPPSFGLLCAPFAGIDAVAGKRAARLAWVLLQLGCLAVCALVLRDLLARRAPPADGIAGEHARWQWLWLGALVLTLRFVLRDTHGGGGNLINVALALLALRDAEHGRERAAGVWLALSLVTKPVLIWLVPVFWLCGRRRTVLWTAACAALAVLATLALQRFDAAPWWRWLHGSWSLATQSDPWAVPSHNFPPFEWMNQALRFCVARWFGTVPDDLAQRVAWGVTPGLGSPPAAVAWLVRAASLALLLAVLHTAWRTRRSPAARTWVVAATLVLALLLSPISWKGHHVALVPAILLLLHHAVTTRSRATIALLAVWFLACALPGGDLVGDAADEWLNSLYFVTLGDVALLLACLARARAAGRAVG